MGKKKTISYLLSPPGSPTTNGWLPLEPAQNIEVCHSNNLKGTGFPPVKEELSLKISAPSINKGKNGIAPLIPFSPQPTQRSGLCSQRGGFRYHPTGLGQELFWETLGRLGQVAPVLAALLGRKPPFRPCDFFEQPGPFCGQLGDAQTITLPPTNMAPDRGHLKRKMVFQVTPHRSHAGWREGMRSDDVLHFVYRNK